MNTQQKRNKYELHHNQIINFKLIEVVEGLFEVDGSKYPTYNTQHFQFLHLLIGNSVDMPSNCPW